MSTMDQRVAAVALMIGPQGTKGFAVQGVRIGDIDTERKMVGHEKHVAVEHM
jgi:hypothetical protein